jgi:hypothetical protein
MLTFYNWYASDNSAHSVRDAGIPLAWTKLKQVTIYPELATLLKFLPPDRTGSMIGNDTKNTQCC